MYKTAYVLPVAHSLPTSPACLPIIHKAAAILVTFSFHAAPKWEIPLGTNQQGGRDSGEMKTSPQYHRDPGSNLSLDFAITSPFFLLIPSFLANTLTPQFFFFFWKLGPQAIRKCFVTLLTISQRLSEKCYSQKLLLQLSCLYRDLDSIPGSRKSWRRATLNISLENSRFPIFKEQSNTLLESNVPMVLRRSTSSLQVGWVSLLINSMTFNEHKAHTPQNSIPHYFT